MARRIRTINGWRSRGPRRAGFHPSPHNASIVLASSATFPVRGSPSIPEEHNTMTSSLPPVAPWSVFFADGSGNITRFWQEAGGEARFEYRPMTPERSSSGIYDGGPARSGALATDAAARLWNLLQGVEADSSTHAATRMMGIGSIRLQDAGGERSFIVGSGPALDALSGFLTGVDAR